VTCDKLGRHDIAEILLKVVLNTKNQSINQATSWWFSLGTSVSSTNKTDRQDIIEILLKVVLNTINQKLNQARLSLTLVKVFRK
jgi:hypothetical protein